MGSFIKKNCLMIQVLLSQQSMLEFIVLSFDHTDLTSQALTLLYVVQQCFVSSLGN
jgi:hypothetical protein